jgi:hypothetical protein
VSGMHCNGGLGDCRRQFGRGEAERFSAERAYREVRAGWTIVVCPLTTINNSSPPFTWMTYGGSLRRTIWFLDGNFM